MRLTKEQAAVIGAHTGVLAGPFSEMHAYIERVMGRPVFTHELGDKGVADQIRDASRGDFIALARETKETKNG